MAPPTGPSPRLPRAAAAEAGPDTSADPQADAGVLEPDPGIQAELDAEFFKALSDPNRLRILACLSTYDGKVSVQDVARCVAVHYSVVARHLKLLAGAGLLAIERCGKTTCYGLRRDDVVDRFTGLAAAFEAGRATGSGTPSCADDACCDATD